MILPSCRGVAMGRSRTDIARELYEAFAAGDRAVAEQRLSKDFTFSAPPDPLLDRDGYFARCWPGAGSDQSFDFKRLVEAGEEVIVTYERLRPDGGRGRNTEILTFDGDEIVRAEVYFGWDVTT
jgi:ketosteroid isomerase-like protein